MGSTLLQDGLDRQRRGDIAGARTLYRSVLQAEPGHGVATTLLGLALCQEQFHEEGLRLIRQAIAAEGTAFQWFSLAQVLVEAGQVEESVPAFRRAIALQPGADTAYAALAQALTRLGRLDEAEAALRAALAIRPEAEGLWLALGMLLRRAGRPAEAETAYRESVQLKPTPEALSCLGNVLVELGQSDEALAALARSIELAPGWALGHFNLGVALRLLRQREASERCYRAALALQPHFPEAWCDLGVVLYELLRLEEAVAAIDTAIVQRPDYALAWLGRGNALQALLRYEEGETAYRTALRLQPDMAAAHSNLSVLLEAQGRLEEALAEQRQALALAPEFSDARYNHAVTLLKAGHYEQGWVFYEERWRLPWSPPRGFAQPVWRGEELAGRTILLHPEQGLGDTLQMVRYAPLVAARGGRVILEAQAPLVRLLRCLPGVEQVVALDDTLPDFDLHCPLFSLPLAFGTSLATVPQAPYLTAAAEEVALWEARLGAAPGLRVGLVWGGAEKIGYVNRHRSMALAAFAPLARLPGLRLISLQKGPPAAQLASADLPIIDLMDQVGDFADTAALVSTLDLVISVDTSTAHLAAAMGKPVWLLSRHNGCWRWLAGREDSPWYPSLTVYRQSSPADWGPVMARLEADLRRLAQQGRDQG